MHRFLGLAKGEPMRIWVTQALAPGRSRAEFRKSGMVIGRLLLLAGGIALLAAALPVGRTMREALALAGIALAFPTRLAVMIGLSVLQRRGRRSTPGPE